jgi:hypothetical protein
LGMLGAMCATFLGKYLAIPRGASRGLYWRGRR